MKFALFFSLLISSFSFAGQIPANLEESRKILTHLNDDEDVSDIINDIKSGKLDPLYIIVNKQVVKSNTHSALTDYVLGRLSRANDNHVGANLDQNFELLDSLLDAGLSLNHFHNGTSIQNFIASNCYLEFLPSLEKRNADLTSEEYLWASAFMASYLALSIDKDDDQNNKCQYMMNYLIKKASGSFSMKTAFRLFYPKDYTWPHYDSGELLDLNLSIKTKGWLKAVSGVSLSKRPSNEEDKNKIGLKLFQEPYGIDLDPETISTWNSFSESEKEWACYYSSFDEAYMYYKKLGFTDDQMANTSIWEYHGHYSKFMLKTFAPYCNSLKN